MKIVYMGTPDFAVDSLEKLLTTRHEIAAVVVQPDKPKGRGMKMIFPPVKEVAIKQGIEAIQPEKIDKEFIEKISKINPDLIVVVAYGKILPKEILELPKCGCINVHASILPKYRGAAPIQRSIINGDKVTGVTTMFMNEGMDTGDMLLKKEVVVEDNDTAQILHDKLAKVGADLLIDTIVELEQNKLKPVKQNDDEATYSPMLKKSEGLIEWSKSAEEIKNKVRGMNPWPGAYSCLNECFYKMWKVEILPDKSGLKPGTIVDSCVKKGLCVATGTNDLRIVEFQAQCGKRMCPEDYLKGNRIDEGEMFG